MVNVLSLIYVVLSRSVQDDDHDTGTDTNIDEVDAAAKRIGKAWQKHVRQQELRERLQGGAKKGGAARPESVHRPSSAPLDDRRLVRQTDDDDDGRFTIACASVDDANKSPFASPQPPSGMTGRGGVSLRGPGGARPALFGYVTSAARPESAHQPGSAPPGDWRRMRNGSCKHSGDDDAPPGARPPPTPLSPLVMPSLVDGSLTERTSLDGSLWSTDRVARRCEFDRAAARRRKANERLAAAEASSSAAEARREAEARARRPVDQGGFMFQVTTTTRERANAAVRNVRVREGPPRQTDRVERPRPPTLAPRRLRATT